MYYWRCHHSLRATASYSIKNKEPFREQKFFWFLGRREGYVKALEKSTSQFSTMRQVIDHPPQDGRAARWKTNVILKVLPILQSGEPIRTRFSKLLC